MADITVAKTAGFCFGVNRAIEIVNRLLDQGKRVYTLGPIIHNPQMVAALEQRGVTIVSQPGQVQPGGILVIRSHGVSLDILREIERLGIEYADATCPFVGKIHQIVFSASEKGVPVLIAGDPDHPEVRGIRGHCQGESYVFRNQNELKNLIKDFPNLESKELFVVAQTTFSVSEWENCLKILKRVYTNAAIFDTICNATSERQAEAVRLAKQKDLMVIIGGRQSSNTAKLKSVCEPFCRTCLIETAKELPVSEIKQEYWNHGGCIHTCQHYKGGTRNHDGYSRKQRND